MPVHIWPSNIGAKRDVVHAVGNFESIRSAPSCATLSIKVLAAVCRDQLNAAETEIDQRQPDQQQHGHEQRDDGGAKPDTEFARLGSEGWVISDVDLPSVAQTAYRCLGIRRRGSLPGQVA